jgi:hypothetical protein
MIYTGSRNGGSLGNEKKHPKVTVTIDVSMGFVCFRYETKEHFTIRVIHKKRQPS